MSKPNNLTKAAPKAGSKAKAAGVAEKKEKQEDLVVFAFRLTPQERDLIHKAAGPAKASRFVRAVAIAAADGDEAAVLKLLGGPAPDIS
jgi:hypothetical protein